MEHEDSAGSGIDAATAARLLHDGEGVGTKVYESIDFRTQAQVQAGTAVATLVYLCAVVFLFGGRDVSEATLAVTGGSGLAITLLIPMLMLSFLIDDVREQLRVALPKRHPRIAIPVGLLVLIPFCVVTVGTIIGQNYPWWVLLFAAVLPAIPPAALAIFSARSARLSDIRPLPSAPRVPLSDAVLLATVGFGVLFGAAAASAAFMWGMAVPAVLILVVLALHRTRWGLPAAGLEWGRAQWLGFGASFVLFITLTVILAAVLDAAPWRGVIGILGGLATATPLVISAFRGSVIHERPEELWHAPTPQS